MRQPRPPVQAGQDVVRGGVVFLPGGQQRRPARWRRVVCVAGTGMQAALMPGGIRAANRACPTAGAPEHEHASPG